jgi:hypothetical protein
MPLMVGMEGHEGFPPILCTVPHSNGTALQFIGVSGKGMRLEVAHEITGKIHKQQSRHRTPA